MEDHEKEWFELAMERASTKAVQPLADELKKHGFSLYGVDGSNGLTSDMKSAKKQLDSLNLWKTKLVAYGSAAGIIAGALADTVKHKLFGN